MQKEKIDYPVIKKKPQYRKEPCLFCDNKATKQAFMVSNDNRHTAGMHCCTNESCQRKAKEMVKGAIELYEKALRLPSSGLLVLEKYRLS